MTPSFGSRLCALSVPVLAAAPALAQSGASIEGRWCFQSAEYQSFAMCSMRGEIELTRAEGEGHGAYTCELWTEESCPEVVPLIAAEQVCVASRDDDALVIRSQVISYDPFGGSYVPDDFTLTVESGQRMTGVLHAPSDPETIFTRCGVPIS